MIQFALFLLALAAVNLMPPRHTVASCDLPSTADRLAERIQIVPSDGSLTYSESDIEMNATGFAMALRRIYRSSNSAEGVFGRGWACLLDRRIDAPERSRVTLHNEFGDSILFLPRGSLLHRSQTGRPQWLLIEKDRALLRDWRGQFWLFDRGGRPTGIFNAAMAGIEVEYQNGRVVRMSDPYERWIRFKADDKGRVVEARSSAGHVRRYEYWEGRLVRVSDGEGVRAEYSYDNQGRLRAIVLAGGEKAEIAYDSEGRVAQLAGAGVAARTVRYQRRTVPFPARVTQIADALGHVVQYRFRDEPRQVQITLPAEATATIDYDKRHLPTRIQLPQNRRLDLRYDEAGNLLRLTLPNGAEYLFGYTGRGDLQQWTRADGATFALERADEMGQIRQVSGPRPENVRQIAFDSLGRLAWLAEGTGRALIFSHTSRGDLSSIAVQGGVSSLFFDHDGAGWISRIAPPGGPSVGTIWGADGWPEVLSDSVGYRLALSRDRLGRLAGIENCEGHRDILEHDESGRPCLWRRPDGSETHLRFDREGNLAELRLPEGNVCRLVYDERNQATSETWLGSQRSVQYDEFGCVAARRNGRNQTMRLTHDSLGRLLETISETGDSNRFQFALDGRLLRVTGRDAEYRFGNDTLGRPNRIAEARSGLWAEYIYDTRGRLLALATPGGRWVREYDSQGRLGRLTLQGEKLWEVRYVYENEHARLPQAAFLPDGTNVAYEYDPCGRIVSVHATLRSGKTALAERYAYDGRGNLARTESSGRRLDFQYDPQNRLVAQYLNGHLYARLHYGRDGRLLKVEGEEGPLEITYDAGGKPVRTSQTRFEYDGDGNRVSRTAAGGTSRYRFDSVGRLASVALPSGTVVSHTYSPNGWPIGQSHRGQTTGFLFIGSLPLSGIRPGGSSPVWFAADPLWARVLGLREGPRTELTYRDALGRIKVIGQSGADSLRSVAWGLFGQRAQAEEPVFYDPLSLDALDFDGRENLSGTHDPATGLSLVPRSLRETLSPYSGNTNLPSLHCTMPQPATGAERALIEDLATACAAGRFAPDEGAILRYLLAASRSPGWPDPGREETFDCVLERTAFRTPSAIARQIIETVLSDGAGGLPALAFSPHVHLPSSWLGLGRFRAICPTLGVLPPVILEGDVAGETIWHEDPMFAGADNVLHGWIGRLVAHSADRSDVRVGDDGCVRLLGELLNLSRWSMHVPGRGRDERLPPAPEPLTIPAALAERRALRDRFLKSLDQTP